MSEAGLFDDLIPGASTRSRTGMFDDLLPGGAPASAGRPAEEERLAGGEASTALGTSVQDWIAAQQPARATMTRRGGAQVLPTNPADTGPYEDASSNHYELPGAEWGDVGRAIIPGAGAQIRGAAAYLRRMANEGNIQGREMVVETPSAYPAGNALPLAVQRGIERQQRLLEQDTAARPGIVEDAEAAKQDLAAATPKDMSTLQRGVFSAATSAPTTLAGIAAGMVTRSPAVTMAIAGGGGSTIQAGSTYGEALDKLTEQGVDPKEAHRRASVAATIDGAIEGLDALPIGIAMKPGSAFGKRMAKMVIAEPGTEGAQGLMQDFRAMAMEDPNKTLGEVWENLKVNVIAGTIGASVYGSIGAAANAGKTNPETKEGRAAIVAEEMRRAVKETDLQAVAPTAEQPHQVETVAAENESPVRVAGLPDAPKKPAGPPPVVDVPESPVPMVVDVKDLSEARKTAGAWAKENIVGTTVKNTETGYDIKIGWQGVRHTLANSYPADVATIPALPAMLESAQYVRSEKPRNPATLGDIKAVHLFESRARLGEDVYRVAITVREMRRTGKLYYDHAAYEKETPDGISGTRGQSPNSERSQPTTGADESVLPDDDTGNGPKNLGMPAHVVSPPAQASAAAAPVQPGTGTGTVGKEQARPDAIRQAMAQLFGAPINEKGISKKYLGIYRIKPETIRLQNRNDLRTAAHEVGHHISNGSKPFRKVMRAHQQELVSIAPAAYIAQAVKQFGSVPAALADGDTRRLLIEEGFAEFIAGFLTAPGTMRAKVPNFHQAFETWLGQNEETAAALEKVGAMIGAHQQLSPAEKMLAKVGTFKPSLGEQAKVLASKDTWDTVTQAALDKWHPLKLMVADLSPGLAASKNPYIAMRMLPGDVAVIEDWVSNFTSPYDYQKRLDTKNYGKPLKEILAPVMKGGEKTLAEFKAYLIALQAAETMKQGKEKLFTREEIAAGLALRTAEFDQVAKEILAYNDRLLDYAIEGGLLSPEVAAKFREYAYFIPFFREPDADAGKPGVGGNPFKRRTGGTANLRDPIANLIQNTANIIHATNRNAAIRKSVELARSVPGGGRWLETVKAPQQAHELATKRIIEQLEQQGVQVDTSMAEGMAAMQTFFTPSGKGDDRTRTIVYKDGGDLKAAQVNDPLLWKAMSNLPPLELDFITKVLAFPARTLRAGVVLDPTFMVRNFVRDTLSAMIQSKGGFIPVLTTAQGIKAQAQNSDAFKLWRSFGGSSSSQFQDSEQAAKVVERMAKRGGFDKLSIVSPMRLLEALEKVGSFTEYGSRIGEFETTYQKGDFESALQAAFNSREVSTDFSMRGGNTSLQVWTRLVPFMNPALQGLYKTGRVLSGADGKGAAVKAAVLGSGMALASMLLALSNADEDWYQRLEEWEKATYWHFRLGGQTWRIPKPFEYGMLFASIPEALALLQQGKEGWDDFKKRMMQVLSQVSIRAVPQVATALAEPWANKSFFTGRKIVPDRQERLEPGLQSNPNTSKVAQAAGEAANVSPAMIDNAVRNVFGTLGVHAETVADLLLEQTGAFPKGRERSWQSWPAIKAFVHDPDNPNTKQQRDFFEQLDKYRTAVNSVRELKARGEEEKADAYSEAHADEIQRAKGGEIAAKRLAKIRKQVRAIDWDRDMEPAEKRSAVNDLNAEAQDIAEEHTRLYQAAKKSYSQPAR